MTTPRSAREQLAIDLRYLRLTAGLTERQLATAIGVTQSRVQRLEQGKGTTPRSVDRQVVRAWAKETGADISTRARLWVLVEAVLRGDDETWEQRLAGREHLQEEMAAQEAAARTIRNFQSVMIPGLLQTPEYAHFVIPLADVGGTMDHNAAVARRLQRQQALFTEEKRFDFLLTEAALCWPGSQPAMVVAQLDRVASLAELESVDLAVLPRGEPVDVVAWHPFILLEGPDLSFVSVEMFHQEDVVVQTVQVEIYRRVYARMWARALTGSDAVVRVRRIAEQLRSNG